VVIRDGAWSFPKDLLLFTVIMRISLLSSESYPPVVGRDGLQERQRPA
jgi:hypothetical protein